MDATLRKFAICGKLALGGIQVDRPHAAEDDVAAPDPCRGPVVGTRERLRTGSASQRLPFLRHH